MSNTATALEGVFAEGYGTIPKAVMHDPELSLESKVIYAYLCALAGSSSVTYPFRDTILRDLGMTKNTYYRHYRPLVQKGYLVVSRTADKRDANRYTLLRRQGGYGLLPRSIMRDPTIEPKAKGLYAYLCAYSGQQRLVFPRREHILHHLDISEPTYYKAYRQLVDMGLVTPLRRVEGGKFATNHYYLNRTPFEVPEEAVSPDTKNGDTVSRDTKNADGYNNTSSAKNNSSNPSPSGTEDDRQREAKLEKVWKALQQCVEKQPSSQRELLAQTLRAAKRLLALPSKQRTSKQQTAAAHLERHLPEADKLWQALQAFAAHFQARSTGRTIRHRQAYLEASLCNWAAAPPPQAVQPPPQRTEAGTASYDVRELERMIAGQAVW